MREAESRGGEGVLMQARGRGCAEMCVRHDRGRQATSAREHGSAFASSAAAALQHGPAFPGRDPSTTLDPVCC